MRIHTNFARKNAKNIRTGTNFDSVKYWSFKLPPYVQHTWMANGTEKWATTSKQKTAHTQRANEREKLVNNADHHQEKQTTDTQLSITTILKMDSKHSSVRKCLRFSCSASLLYSGCIRLCAFVYVSMLWDFFWTFSKFNR